MSVQSVLRPLHPSIRRTDADAAYNPALPLTTVTMGEAAWPKPFSLGIEYSPPARGPGTMAPVGMLMPSIH